MRICPNCQYKNVAEAVVCAECGVHLDKAKTADTMTVKLTPEQREELKSVAHLVTCPNCQYKNVGGAMFCAECGARLDSIDTLITQVITDGEIEEELEGVLEYQLRKRARADIPANSWISLHLMDSGKLLHLGSKSEFTLGRLSEKQPVIPDIDLTPYQAYASGVSRLHMVIKRESTRVVIMDLASSNGTFLNGRRINPHVEETLSHGDIVALGKLKIQVLLRNI